MTVAEAQRPLEFVRDDGGRAESGLLPLLFTAKGRGDCQCRAISIATGRPYWQVHAGLAELADGGAESVDHGAGPDVGKFYLTLLGWRFTLNTRHLAMSDLPRTGSFVLVFVGRTQGHLSALVDGVNRDLDDHRDANLWGWWSPDGWP